MGDEPPPPHKPPVGDGKDSIAAFASALPRFAWPLAFVIVVFLVLGFLRDRPPPAPASTVRVDHPGATVVRELKALARLETMALHVEKVVDVKDQQKRFMGMIDAQDALLFVASGEVILGVDLGKLRSEDVAFDEKTGAVTMTLPSPEVLSARFDEVRSYVHTRSTDTLAKRNEELESFARRDAIASFEAAGREPQIWSERRSGPKSSCGRWPRRGAPKTSSSPGARPRPTPAGRKRR